HEINNPLAVVVGQAQLLEETLDAAGRPARRDPRGRATDPGDRRSAEAHQPARAGRHVATGAGDARHREIELRRHERVGLIAVRAPAWACDAAGAHVSRGATRSAKRRIDVSTRAWGIWPPGFIHADRLEKPSAWRSSSSRSTTA